MGFCGFIWVYRGLYGFTWIYMGLDCFMWVYMGSDGFIYRRELYGFMGGSNHPKWWNIEH
jgi:hypothetical protein